MEWTRERVEEALILARGVVSLDDPIRVPSGEYSDETTLADTIASEEPSPLQVLLDNTKVEMVADMLANALTPREKQIIEWRFGINTQCVHSLQDCGDALGLTRERVRQIEEKAIRKLRRYVQKKHIKGDEWDA